MIRPTRLPLTLTLSLLAAAGCAVHDAALSQPEQDALARAEQGLVSEVAPFDDEAEPSPEPFADAADAGAYEELPEEDGGVVIVEDAEELIGWEDTDLPIKKGPDGVAAGREGAAARRSGKCIWPTFSRFPGSAGTGPKLRYGQVDVKFEICADRHPSDWKATISAWNNGTASLQGYDFINEQVDTTSGGDYYRFYRATFKLRDCAPYFAWPCTTKGTFSIDFYAYVVEGKPYVSLQTAKAPAWWSLYKTR